MKPNIEEYNPDPTYLRCLIDKAELGQNLAGKLVGVNTDNFRKMMTGRVTAPYSVQYALEGLVGDDEMVKKMQKDSKDHKNQGKSEQVNR